MVTLRVRCLLLSAFGLAYQHLKTSSDLTSILIYNLLGRYLLLSAFRLSYLAPISIQHFVASFHLSLIVRNLYGMETSYLKLIGYSYVPHADQTMIFLLSSYCYLKLKFRKIVNAPPLRGVARVFKECQEEKAA